MAGKTINIDDLPEEIPAAVVASPKGPINIDDLPDEIPVQPAKDVRKSGLLPETREELDSLLPSAQDASMLTDIVGRIPVIGPLRDAFGDAVEAALDPKLGYSEVRARRLEALKQLDKRNPVLSTVADMAGGALLPVPGGGAAKVVDGASKLARLGTKAAQIGGVATREAAIAGADAAMRDRDALDAAQIAGGTVAGLGVGTEVLPAIKRGFSKYVLGIADPDTMASKYVARKPQINAADEEELYDAVVRSADDVRDFNRSAQRFADDAKEDFRAAREALRAELIGTKPPRELSESAVEAVDTLGRQVSEASSKAFDVLNDSDVEIPLPRIKAFLTTEMNKFKTNGKPLPGADGDIASLQQWRQFFDDIGDKTARPEQVKGFIMHLDETTRPLYAKRRDELTRGERSLLRFRSFMDDYLKTDVPGYAEAMAPVAADMKILSQVRKMFGNEVRADRTLQRIARDSQGREMDVLKSLSDRLGEDLVGPLQPTISARMSSRGPAFAQQTDMLPEALDATRIGAANDALQEATKFERRFTEANAQASLKRLRGNTNPISLRRDLEELSRYSGIDFVQMNDDLAMQEAFEKGFTHGSRNVNLQGVSVAAMASLLGTGVQQLPVIGAALGVITGAVTDKAGPKIFKAMLDLSLEPRWRQTVGVLEEAARRSPQAFAQAFTAETQKNPELATTLRGHIDGQRSQASETLTKWKATPVGSSWSQQLSGSYPKTAAMIEQAAADLDPADTEIVISDPQTVAARKAEIMSNKAGSSIAAASELSQINETGSFRVKVPPRVIQAQAPAMPAGRSAEDLLRILGG